MPHSTVHKTQVQVLVYLQVEVARSRVQEPTAKARGHDVRGPGKNSLLGAHRHTSVVALHVLPHRLSLKLARHGTDTIVTVQTLRDYRRTRQRRTESDATPNRKCSGPSRPQPRSTAQPRHDNDGRCRERHAHDGACPPRPRPPAGVAARPARKARVCRRLNGHTR